MTTTLKSQALAALLVQVALFSTAAANPITFTKSQAAAGPRSDVGTGLCGSATHFLATQPLNNRAEAVAILDKPTTDPAVLERATRIFGNLNLRNGQTNAAGDFTQPAAPDALLPFSKDAAALPMGTDSNIAFRLRGYFNVPATLAGKTLSFGVNCDDFCALQIGKTTVLTADERISARVIKQVIFGDAGLYPVELIYYQNGSTAFLEWARADTAVQECPNDICLTPLTDAGSYCGDGLCQTCNTADHCGASCQVCPATARQCSAAGTCVECTTSTQCTGGGSCDVASGRCQTTPGSDPKYEGGNGCTVGGAAAAQNSGWLMLGCLAALGLGVLLRRRARTAA
jgi:outer membrane exchange protein TraA